MLSTADVAKILGVKIAEVRNAATSIRNQESVQFGVAGKGGFHYRSDEIDRIKARIKGFAS